MCCVKRRNGLAQALHPTRQTVNAVEPGPWCNSPLAAQLLSHHFSWVLLHDPVRCHAVWTGRFCILRCSSHSSFTTPTAGHAESWRRTIVWLRWRRLQRITLCVTAHSTSTSSGGSGRRQRQGVGISGISGSGVAGIGGGGVAGIAGGGIGGIAGGGFGGSFGGGFGGGISGGGFGGISGGIGGISGGIGGIGISGGFGGIGGISGGIGGSIGGIGGISGGIGGNGFGGGMMAVGSAGSVAMRWYRRWYDGHGRYWRHGQV